MSTSEAEEFKQLYYSLQPALVAYAKYFVRSEEDAVELVNDVFLSIWDKRVELEFNSELKSYLYTSVKNRCYNFIKKNKLETSSLELVSDREEMAKSSDRIETKDKVAQINSILASLPDRCKMVFLLSRVNGFSNREIANLLDISTKTVENQMTKALKTFRENI